MQLPHGYTNETTLTERGEVSKRYIGNDAAARQEREAACLTALGPWLPVPAVLAVYDGWTLIQHCPGRHGQDLLVEGHGDIVLRLAGQLLRRLGAIAPDPVAGLGGEGRHIVHGDFGPQNMLLDGTRVTALLDWEFAHRGDPIEDLAWCEWIVRMHHSDQVPRLPTLFEGYGEQPPWRDRHQAMIAKCEVLAQRSREKKLPEAARLWRDRLTMVIRWTD